MVVEESRETSVAAANASAGANNANAPPARIFLIIERFVMS
jgi:hypothetical protein